MSKKPPGHQPRRRFGQNFLQDTQYIERILAAVAPAPEDALVEIGPGRGALTEPLLEAGARLILVELDRDLIPILRTRLFRHLERLEIHQADALRLDFESLRADDRPLRILGNLPYNISTPLIFHLLAQSAIIKDMHFMLQKEVVDRMAASVGNKGWGRLSVMTQYRCRVEPLFEVPPQAFHPRPRVTSAVVRLRPHAHPPRARNEADFAALVRTAFNQRRKTLRNTLKPLLDAPAMEAAGIDPGLRPERLSLEDFIRLADAYTASCNSEGPPAS